MGAAAARFGSNVVWPLPPGRPEQREQRAWFWAMDSSCPFAARRCHGPAVRMISPSVHSRPFPAAAQFVLV
jgi:hypothetical protein